MLHLRFGTLNDESICLSEPQRRFLSNYRGSIKEVRGFEATLFVDMELRKCMLKSIYFVVRCVGRNQIIGAGGQTLNRKSTINTNL